MNPLDTLNCKHTLFSNNQRIVRFVLGLRSLIRQEQLSLRLYHAPNQET